jgi:hypothetical protein
MVIRAPKFVHHQIAYPAAQPAVKVAILQHLLRTIAIATYLLFRRPNRQNQQPYLEKA